VPNFVFIGQTVTNVNIVIVKILDLGFGVGLTGPNEDPSLAALVC